MFAILVIIIVAVGLVATLGYTIFSFQRSAEMSAMVLQNTSRMDVIAMTLRSASRPLVAGGPVRLPAGSIIPAGNGVNADRLTVPSGIVGSNLTPWGAEYGYCVYDASSVGGETVAGVQSSADGEMTLAEIDGESYVIGHDAPEVVGIPSSNVIGFVVAPTPGRQQLPACSQIVFDAGTFLINGLVAEGAPPVGGTVVPIMAEATRLSMQSARMEQTLFVTSAEGMSGSGESVMSRMSLDDAMDYWNDSTLSYLILDLDGAIPVDTLNQRKQNGTLAIRGGAISAPVVGGLTEWVKVGSGLDLEGVEVGSNVGIQVLGTGDLHVGSRRTGTTSAVHSTIGRVRVDGGDALIEAGTTIVGSDASMVPIEVASGALRLSPFLLSMASEYTAPSSVTISGAAAAAIVATGGDVSVMTNINAAGHALPWSIDGSASFDVGASGLVAAYASGTVPISLTSQISTAMNGGGIAVAACPAIQPHVIGGGCEANDGMLSSSHSNGDSWSCRWSTWSGTTTAGTVSIPLASNAMAHATCAIAP